MYEAGVSLIVWNGIVCLVYGLDKLLAKLNAWRLPEWPLLTLALLMGGVGALAGSLLFNHKTAKWKFRVLLPLAAVLTVFVAGYVYYYWHN